MTRSSSSPPSFTYPEGKIGAVYGPVNPLDVVFLVPIYYLGAN